jgi:hypothetical protein
MVVAGFVSSAADWASFSIEWNKRLSRDNLPWFHMKEILSWDLPESGRRALLRDLMAIIKEHAYRKFGTALLTRDLVGRISIADRRRWHLCAYSLAGGACADHVDKWVGRERMTSPVAYFFEEGDVGAGLLRERMVQEGLPAPNFLPGKRPRKTKHGRIARHFLPLQAADFVAGEYFKHIDNEIRRPGRMSKPRWAFTEFEKMVGQVYAIDYPGAEGFLRMLEMSKRMGECLALPSRALTDCGPPPASTNPPPGPH